MERSIIENLPKVNILVTGGTGFIGSNLCKRLIKNENNRVICVDNNYTGSLDNVRELLTNSRFKFIEHDIIEPLNIKEKINKDLKIVYKSLPADDLTQRCPDITLAKTKLNWKPKVKLSEGLDKTIGYFDKKFKGEI